MIYLLKFVLCSGLLYAFYHLVLRNDKIFMFNRFFLLSIVILAAAIPCITIKTRIVEVPTAQTIAAVNPVFEGQPETSPLTVSLPQPFDLAQFLITAYIVITSLLLFKFILNLWSLNRFKKGGKIIYHNGLNIVLRPDILHSFSFLNYMYTNKESFERGELPKEIIVHEQAHIDQKHSYDILFIELITCLFWFNPFVYFVKQAIKLNHEFLADETTISETGSFVQYQNIIINFASKQLKHNPILASHLTFGETKKRITIMAKKQNKTLNFIRQVAALVVVIILFAFLGKTEVMAQQDVVTPPPPIKKQQTETKSEADQDIPDVLPSPPVRVLLHLKSTVSYIDENGKLIEGTFEELPKQVQKDFIALKLEGKVWLPPPPPAHITVAMLEDFQNSTEYGVWIDNDPVENNRLKDYEPGDFYLYYKSRLRKNHKNYGEYTHRVTLITKKSFEDGLYNGKWIKFSGAKMASEEVLTLAESKD